MIEVQVPISVTEYRNVLDDLEDRFAAQGLAVWLSADTVIRTWAGLTFYEWFAAHETDVDTHIGWGQITMGSQGETTLAAVSSDFVDQDHTPVVVMIFHDDDIDDVYVAKQRSLATMFKLAFGGI